ncbi:MAG: undecaprenyldiphospho-muramoylpentapeptide beta-N-acetylglucosaminyltransferase [Acidobacteriota bacterium]|nr:undecaprenyldiphospho-muramoylpentapeptide beta-N-acetylglucosaminyltransferase [Acidobacteriota bacterium]MDE3260574.1 undecaprenyldiphospho-muramoylpentapeptide beta-N-acetylglucosaminyltransferase [Acidobacteriota bacterium]
MSRLLVAAAGSGGHIYPGLAVARAFAERGPAEVRFVGTAAGLEGRLVPQHGFALELVEVPPIRGRSPLVLPRTSVRLLRSLRQMRRLLREFRPEVVFGTGGSVSGVAVFAARLLGIPSLILEPNAEPGFATRWSAPFATEVAVAWEGTRRHFRRRALLSGVPVRREFLGLAPAPGNNGTVSVLVTGGSQGASRLNRLVTAALPELRAWGGRLRITHQTGPAEEARVRKVYRDAGLGADVVAYLDDMPRAMAAADLVVGRAGAITCAELAAAGRPAILVPAPVAGGHQRQNAAALAAAGAALSMDEGASGAEFASALFSLLDDPSRREDMAGAARRLVRDRPAERLAARLHDLAGGPA